MADIIKNHEILKRLGFEGTNQWMFYDERFRKFFKFFITHITEQNIFTELELADREQFSEKGPYLTDGKESRAKMLELQKEYPGMLEYTGADVAALTMEVTLLIECGAEYVSLLDDMCYTKTNINFKLNKFGETSNALEYADKELMFECQQKTKQLEELLRENIKLGNEAKKCFSKTQSSPLFIHQLPLDQYFLKCDSFMQYFNLYMKENFIMQDYIEINNHTADNNEVIEKLEMLQKSVQNYTFAYIEEKSKANSTQALIVNLDASKIHFITRKDLLRETYELKLLNDHHLQISYETLRNYLTGKVEERTQQRMELLLYENTKQKFTRALKRHESDKRLRTIIANSLTNAELLWIAIQLDLERKRKQVDSTEICRQEAQACLQRIKSMRSCQAMVAPRDTSEVLMTRLSVELMKHLLKIVPCEVKACLFEYEKFGRLLAYARNNLLNRKQTGLMKTQLNEFEHLTYVMQPYIYDSPVFMPMVDQVRFITPIFKMKIEISDIEKKLRGLRDNFKENILDKFHKDKLWRYCQLLWIWFLTEPKRVLVAIDDAKRAASQVPSMTGVKSLGGIKRI